MTYVAINVLTVPDGAGTTLEQRFGARKAAVDTAPGFRSFELLRPVEGTADYLVVTRWDTQADFDTWSASQAFRQGHGQTTTQNSPPPAATGATVWSFEVAQESWATQPN